jgi:hypothetical protein
VDSDVLTRVDSLLEALSVDLTPSCAQVVSEARRVRDEVRGGDPEDTVPDLHEQLVFNRAQIDYLEAMTSRMLLARARTQQAVSDAKDAVDDAVMKTATKPSSRLGEFASAKEKEAFYALGAVNEKMTLRKAERLHRDIDSTWDYCRVLLRGAEQVQRDLETRMRMLSISGVLGG